ncbi:MAG: hypothetical protein RIQ37_370 [Actinomycetota bacterium]
MVSRRGFLAGSAIAGSSAAVGIATGATASQVFGETELKTAKTSHEFFGPHQMGIELPIQSVTNFVTLDLKSTTDLAAMKRWMLLLTDDIQRLAKGEPVLADPNPELSIGAAGFSAYVGFGYSLFEKLNLQNELPSGFIELPSFKMDKFQEEFVGGDVLIHVAADDPIVLSHATRSLIRDSMPFATLRSMQAGFAHSPGMVSEGVTHRNLMGQIDGTANPKLNTSDFDDVVWIQDGPQWIQGGTLLVYRRIEMNLDTWDQLGAPAKEEVIGRKLSNGAPLTGEKESDIPDLDARHANGLKVIPEFAHIRRAAPDAPGERIFRRPFSYELPATQAGSANVGLIWNAYQRDIEKQFLPIQRRLEQLDLLNNWTTPIGSAVFAIPRGVAPGEVIGQGLFF